MKAVKNGSKIKVSYTGMFSDGSVFDSSEKENPLEFVVGNNEVIEGFDEAVLGMQLNDEKTVTISEDKAYGPYDKSLSMVVDINDIGENIELNIGDELEFTDEDNESIIFTVIDIQDNEVTLDANHPLAGQELTFKISVVDIQ
jgi:peptidylprolyl isomerase